MATATITLQNPIDGELVDASSGETEAVINPATGEEIARMPLSTAEDVDRAVAAAKRAKPGWAATPSGCRPCSSASPPVGSGWRCAGCRS